MIKKAKSNNSSALQFLRNFVGDGLKSHVKLIKFIEKENKYFTVKSF